MRLAKFFLIILAIFSFLSLEARSSGGFLHWQSSSRHLGSSWVEQTLGEYRSVKLLLARLESSPTGRTLLSLGRKKARSLGRELSELIHPSARSLLNTTLIRSFSESNPQDVTYLLRSEIHLNRELSVVEALRDLVHELTHFVERDFFNPYSSPFSPGDFLVHTVQGRGERCRLIPTSVGFWRSFLPRGVEGGESALIFRTLGGSTPRAGRPNSFTEWGRTTKKWSKY